MLNVFLLSALFLLKSTLSLSQSLTLRSDLSPSSFLSSPFFKNHKANNEINVKGGIVIKEEKITVIGEFTVAAVTTNELQNRSILAVYQAVYNISSHAKSCEIESATLDTHHRERRRNLKTTIGLEGLTQSTYTFDISFHCTYFIDTTFLPFPFNATYIKNEKIKEINMLVDDRTFENKIRYFALYSNATELLHATCETMTFSASEGEVGAHHDDSADLGDSSSSSSNSKVIGLIVGTIFGIYLLFVAIFCGLKRYGVVFGGSSKINVSLEE
jgi:hypothetical protein